MDLVDYLNSVEHSALLQAALTHSQFEIIHPFGDGNGRVGRALIHVVLRGRGLATRFVPPISLVLATHSRDYVRGLAASIAAIPGAFRLQKVLRNGWGFSLPPLHEPLPMQPVLASE